MKKIAQVISILILVSKISFGQEQITIYLNSRLEITNKDKAEYKCDAEYDLDHFRLNGKIQCSSLGNLPMLMLTYKGGLKNGQARMYSKTGNPIFEGCYENNHRSGIWKYYYSNGSLWQTIKFIDDAHSQSNDANIMVGEYYDRNGNQLVKNGNGIWAYDSIYYSMPDQTSLKLLRGNFKDSLKHGTWELIRLYDMKIMHRENFRKGKFVNGQFAIEPDAGVGIMPHEMTQKFPDQNESIFHNLETFKLDSTVFDPSIVSMDTEELLEAVTGVKYKIKNRSAGYKYGDYELMELIAVNTRYPKEARQLGVSGTVIVQFTIDKNGVARDFKILKGIHESLNNEAIRVISSIKDWVSEIQNGEPYEKTIAIPIKFRM